MKHMFRLTRFVERYTIFTPSFNKDGTECIAEVGVMIDRGDADKVPKDAMELFIKYMGNRL